MKTGLDPVVAKKLLKFRRRRFLFLLTRGMCAGLVTFILAMSLVAVADWYWLMTENVRWMLSGGAYLAVLATVWGTSLRRLVERPALEAVASQVEDSEPELRENLLSAVELATDDPQAIHDSPVFRSLLQGQVAQQMAKVCVPKLLPFRLITKWVVAAAVLVIALICVLTSEDGRYRQLATRAVLPGANVARVSRIQVQILEPTPHSLVLAEDETVAIVVDVTGGAVDDVVLETETQSQGAVRHVMRNRGDRESEFVTNLHVQDEAIEYRVLAGDAITQRFLIETRPRPQVVNFQKTFRFPEYAQLPEETVREPNGDLIVLAGTQTKLTLELDQQVSLAELRIDFDDREEATVVPLTKNDYHKGPTWQAEIPIEASGIYQVHLVSQETGFENVFSPKYVIQPQPDMIPRAGFVDQSQATLILPPNDLLQLQGMAEDDLPLQQLEQQVSINGQEWETIPLEMLPAENGDGRQVRANWQWDLLAHQLTTGDQLLTRLVATDRMGHRGESIPLRILIAAPDFDPDRHRQMQLKAELSTKFRDFSSLLEQQQSTAHEVIDRMGTADRAAEERQLDRTTLNDLLVKQREAGVDLLYEVRRIEREMPAGADAAELDLAGRVISRVTREYASQPDALLQGLLLAEDEKQANSDRNQLKKSFNRAADNAKAVADHYEWFVTQNVLTAIALDLAALLKHQQLIVDSPTQSWERLLRQETLAVSQLEAVENLIHDQRSHLPRSIDDRLRRVISWSESQRLRLKDAMESEDQLEQLQRVSREFLQQLTHQQKIDTIDGGLPGRLVQGRRDLENRAGWLASDIEELARSIEQERRLLVQATESNDSQTGQQVQQQAQRVTLEIERAHRVRLEQLRDRRELTQVRQDADMQFVADAGLTQRAVTSQLNLHRSLSPQESVVHEHLREIAPAYRMLEAGHEFVLAHSVLQTLLSTEQWESQSPMATLDHPRQWDLFQKSMEFASNALRDARIDSKIVDEMNQIRWSQSVRDADRRIGVRRWQREAIVPATHELSEIHSRLTELSSLLEPVLAEARAIIAKYAPTIPEMAQQSADRIREFERSTTQTADRLQAPDDADAVNQMSELQRQQEALNQQIADLYEALEQDANAQDLLDEQQRERARDADDAVAMIQEPAAKMNQKLEQAQQATEPQAQAKELSQAAEQQERTAQALEKVAEHFARLDEGLDVAQSRAELRQFEQQQGLARQMDQQFDPIGELAAMANQNPESLLQQLEDELQQNPAMQQALSEISQNILQEAQRSLELAAQDEQSIQRANERSDESFQARKREIAESLKELARETSQLSSQLVAQANQSAARGKSESAQQQLAAAQQKLNEAATQSNTANQDQLLSELAATARKTQSAIQEATETLQQAKQQTAAGKDEQLFDEEKKRQQAQKDAENRRRQFHEQQKRTARDNLKRAEDAKRRADQNVRNAENQVRNFDRQIQSTQRNLNRQPDNDGLKRNLQQQQQRKADAQEKLDIAQQERNTAQQQVDEMRREMDQINRQPMPPLNAANPETQLADLYTEQAIKKAEELQQAANEVASKLDFQNELRPGQNQLASAETQQSDVQTDVEQTAADLARAARHERRLNNEAAAGPLQSKSEQVRQVADQPVEQAQQQLSSAKDEAAQADEQELKGNQRPNQDSLQAQAALKTSEAAIAQQAEQLTEMLNSLTATATAQAAQSTEASAQTNAGEASADAAANTGQPSADPEFTPEQSARGQQLARMLDDLDRAQATAAANANDAGQQSSPVLPSLAQAAQSQQARLAAARAQHQQQALMTLAEGPTDSTGVPAATGAMQGFEVGFVDRASRTDWGKLRSQSADDLATGKTETVSEEYRKSVEAYFKALAERARK